VEKIAQIPRLEVQKVKLELKKFGSGNLVTQALGADPFTSDDETFLKIVDTRLEKVTKCADFIKGIG